MQEPFKLKTSLQKTLRNVDPMLMSYNIEFAEVTGGTFWKAYTPAQVAGAEDFTIDPSIPPAERQRALMQVYPPIDMYNAKLRKLAKAFGPVWVRVSGTWATKTYYDFAGELSPGEVPQGYLNVLTKQQWIGVLDFVKAVGGKLMISLANCKGLHNAEEPWPSSEAEKIFALSKQYGVPISAAEFANEPNMMEGTGFPKGYTPAHFARDQDLFFVWVRKNYPECLCVGPSNIGPDNAQGQYGDKKAGGGIELTMKSCYCRDLLDDTKEPLDVFSYHYYNGVSERLAAIVPHGHWQAEEAISEDYLAVAINTARNCGKLRDKYCPGGQLWVTESGDAAGGGNTWASTYLDVFRTLNELGGFAAFTDGVIFHNTLSASDYGFLDHSSHEPRPNYFAALLWNNLMGTTVFEAEEVIRMGAHVYVHSRKDGKQGLAYLVINNSLTESILVDIPKEATVYTLAGKDGNVRATVMTLNGVDLVLTGEDGMPDMTGTTKPAGILELPPATCSFVIL